MSDKTPRHIELHPENTLGHQFRPRKHPETPMLSHKKIVRHHISTGNHPETSIFTHKTPRDIEFQPENALTHRISNGKCPDPSLLSQKTPWDIKFQQEITLRHQFWHGKKAWDIHREPKRSSLRLKFWLENTLSHQRWIRNDRDTLIVTQHTPWDIINFVPENTARRAIPAEKKLTLTYHSPGTSILTHKRPETSVLSQKTPSDINIKPVNTLRQQFWRGKKPETSTVTQRTLWYINFT